MINDFNVNENPVNGAFEFTEYLSPNSDAAFFVTAGVNYLRPFLRGVSAVLVIENRRSGSPWVLEETAATLRGAGRRRL